MQQPKTRWKVRKELRKIRLYGCNDAGPQPSRPATMPDLELYVVQMRNRPPGESGTWATLVRTYRDAAGLSQQGLADAVGTDRSTVWRWENRNQKPESYTMARKVIDRLAVPKDAGLAAAGYGGEDAAPDPFAFVREMGLDPNNRVVRRILGIPDISDEMRDLLLKREKEFQDRDEQRRVDELETIVDLQQRRRGTG